MGLISDLSHFFVFVCPIQLATSSFDYLGFLDIFPCKNAVLDWLVGYTL